MTPERLEEIRAYVDTPIVLELLAEVDRLTRENRELRDTTKSIRRLLIAIKSFCFNHRSRVGAVPPPGPYCNPQDVPEGDSLAGLANAVLSIEDKIRETCDKTADIEDAPEWKK